MEVAAVIDRCYFLRRYSKSDNLQFAMSSVAVIRVLGLYPPKSPCPRRNDVPLYLHRPWPVIWEVTSFAFQPSTRHRQVQTTKQQVSFTTQPHHTHAREPQWTSLRSCLAATRTSRAVRPLPLLPHNPHPFRPATMSKALTASSFTPR